MADSAAIAMLEREHEIILKATGALARLASALDEGKAVDAGMLGEAVRFLRQYADTCHHGKEEDLLFPAIGAHGMPEEGGPVGMMMQEHVEVRAQIDAFADAVTAYGAGEPGAGARLAGALAPIPELYGDHIWKENNVLYPMAEQLLAPAALDELERRFQDVEASMPAGLQDWAVAFADRLEREAVG